MFLRAKNKSGFTPLHIALQYNHFELARFLIEQDFELAFERDEEGMRPIIYATFMEDAMDFFIWLFEKMSDFIVEKTYQKCYPIHLAAWQGNIKLVEYLLEKTLQELLES